jgi:glycosyltransferase involved in cell wall biosynthesis
MGEELRGRTPANVRWAGHVEGQAKEHLLANCRAVVLPHLWEEPLGLVVYEAYQAGKPVLASALGGVRDIVQDGITGALLAPGDPAAWEQALRQWDAAKLREWGLAGRRWLERNTSPEAWHEQFLEIVRPLIKAS